MGYRISSLLELESNLTDWHAILLGYGRNRWIDAWVDSNFNALARDIGKAGVVVAGLDEQLSIDVEKFFERYAETFPQELFSNALSCVLSRGALSVTQNRVLVFPLAVGEEVNTDDAASLAGHLVIEIISAIESDEVERLAQRLGSQEIELEGGLSVALTTLSDMNSVIELKPNIAGIGVNLNASIDSFLDKFRRRTV